MRPHTPPHLHFRRVGSVLLLVALFLCAVSEQAFAEDGALSVTRTFTAPDGRSIDGELLGFRDDRLRVRRKDTNREVVLQLSQLSTQDQTELRELMRKRPDLRDVLPGNAVRLQVSRAKLRPRFGSAAFDTIETEAWAYAVTVGNQFPHEIAKLRIDYLLIGESHRQKGSSRQNNEERIRGKGSMTLENLKAGAFVTKRTVPLICISHLQYAEVLRNGTYFTDYNKVVKRTRITSLKSIALRVYDGEDLMLEQTFPDHLPLEDWSARDTNREQFEGDIRYSEFFRDFPER